MNLRKLCVLALLAFHLFPSLGRAQSYVPGNGYVRGPDFKYYPKHLHGESVKNAMKQYGKPNPMESLLRRTSPSTRPRKPPVQQRLTPTVQSVREYSAPNVGVAFALVRVGNAVGARLTRSPSAGSAAARLGLEPGDTIVMLDELPIRAPGDVLNHYGRTTFVFINGRTGRLQSAVMTLPVQETEAGRPGKSPAPNAKRGTLARG